MALFNLEHLLKVIDPEPVVIAHEACLVARHRNSACRRCLTECPEEALRLEAGKVMVDPAKCSRCGLCAGVCPTAAATVRGIDDGLVRGHGSVCCARAEGSGAQVPCLGYLTEDDLMTMALRHERVELVHGSCSTCPWESGGRRAEQVVERVGQLLTALGSPHQVRLTGDGGEGAAPRSLSRRDLFSLWRTESAQVARQLLPERELNHAKLPARVPARRGRWLRQVNPAELSGQAAMPEGPWKARQVSDLCTGCSICTAFCPTGALAASTEGADWILTHQAAACVACNTCVELCPVKAVGDEPLTVREMVEGKAREVVRLATLRCRNCRREFKGRPGEVQCPQCRSFFSGLL